jgi:hypothetical protein
MRGVEAASSIDGEITVDMGWDSKTGHTPQRAETKDHEFFQVGHRMRGGLAFSLEPILVMERDGFDEAAGADDGAVGEISDSMEQLVDKSRVLE